MIGGRFFLMLLAVLLPAFGAAGAPGFTAPNQDEEVGALGSGKLPDDYKSYRFEAESADGSLSIDLTLGPAYKMANCQILYRAKSAGDQETPVKSCAYDAAKKTLTADFKGNKAGATALRARLTVSKAVILSQRVLETSLSFADRRTVRFDAAQTGHYFLQNKPTCELTFSDDKVGRPHEFKTGPKVVAITLAYALGNEAFVRQLAAERKWELLKRETAYELNKDGFALRIPESEKIADLLERYSSVDRIMCFSYEDK